MPAQRAKLRRCSLPGNPPQHRNARMSEARRVQATIIPVGNRYFDLSINMAMKQFTNALGISVRDSIRKGGALTIRLSLASKLQAHAN